MEKKSNGVINELRRELAAANKKSEKFEKQAIIYKEKIEKANDIYRNKAFVTSQLDTNGELIPCFDKKMYQQMAGFLDPIVLPDGWTVQIMSCCTKTKSHKTKEDCGLSHCKGWKDQKLYYNNTTGKYSQTLPTESGEDRRRRLLDRLVRSEMSF